MKIVYFLDCEGKNWKDLMDRIRDEHFYGIPSSLHLLSYTFLIWISVKRLKVGKDTDWFNIYIAVVENSWQVFKAARITQAGKVLMLKQQYNVQVNIIDEIPIRNCKGINKTTEAQFEQLLFECVRNDTYKVYRTYG